MSRSQSGAFAGARFRVLFAAVVSLAAIAVSQAAIATPAAAAESTVSEGRLLWGVKESWRKYIGLGAEAGEGAAVTGWVPDADGDPLYAEGFSFPILSGTFDDETETTKLRFGGYVHFSAYCEPTPPNRCLLDTKYSDLELEIGPGAQVLRGTHTGYLRTDPGGELHVDEDVVLAKYEIRAASTDFAGGASKWTGIPTVAGAGNGLYVESTILDQTSFEYVGPGGVPDLSEKWDTAGAPGLVAASAWLADPTTSARVLYPAAEGGIVHTVDLVGARSVAAKLVVAALDADTLEPVGTPFTWAFPGALKNDRQELRTAFDPETGSLFFVTYNEGAGRDEATLRRAVWDAGAQSYAVEVVGGLGTLAGTERVDSIAWNPVEDEVAAIARAGEAGDGIYATNLLHRFHREGGGWVHEQTLLRLPDGGEWAGATAVDSPFTAGAATEADPQALAVARDGSYVSAAGTGGAQVAGVQQRYPALRIVVAGDGSATVVPIAGTTTPRTAIGTYYGFASLATAADGSLLLHNSNQVMDAYAHLDIVGGEAVRVGGIVDAPADAFPPYELSGFANSMAADPGHGIVWATDTFSAEGFRLNALRGDEIIGRYANSEFPEAAAKGAYSRLAVAPDGDVYLPIKEKVSGRLGFRRLAFTGFVPELTAQPQDRSVVLGPGETAKTVQFSVAVAGSGTAIQWQSKSPGASVFADLPGATGATLAVEAKPVSNGAVYRAVVANAAGRVASAEADLEVSYAPAVVSDLADREVQEGSDALFVLSADGNPEPQVQWQRRVGGFWEAIAPDDDNFAVNGSALTVLETNLEQSGTLLRARLSNSAGTVFSRVAELTVTPRTTIPPGGVALDHVSLDWTGNAEMQKAPPVGGSNYFSAGVSAGNEATYSAAAGNVRVFQVAPGGAETAATWATRAAHVGSGDDQLVRLYGGAGRVEEDGSAAVAWKGSFSVNFYGGLVPFTLTDPELQVEADGDGTLSADLGGCASSQAEPGRCDPLAPVADVTVATFSGVEVDPGGKVAIEPDYTGVEIDVQPPYVAQNRTAPGWGAWPQEFVDFQALTGLAPYWYSSGGVADPDKRPTPVLVDFDGEALPQPPTPAGNDGNGGGGGAGGSAGGGSGGATVPAPGAPTAPRLRGRPVGDDGIARLPKLSCKAEGCAIKAPRRVRVRIDGKRFWAEVIAPELLGKGQRASLRVRLPKAALARLAGRTTTVRVKVRLLSGKRARVRILKVKVRYVPGAKGGSAKAAPGAAAAGPKSAPITSAEPPTMARPATAVDVGAVKISWFPRDSWVRYASSGVGPNDGIATAGGAVGTKSKASLCPDRPSSSDAELDYQVDFAPRPSWYDPVSGAAGIYGQGSVAFRWAAHTIDLTAADPEIEIAGPASRAIFRFQGSGGTAYPNQRAALVSLDTAGRPAVSNGGKTLTYSLMRGTLTADGVNVFAGFYTPPDNDEFGCISVQFTLP